MNYNPLDVPAVARTARGIITHPQHHAIGTWARDADHADVPWWDDQAYCFCYFGALRRAAWEHLGEPLVTPDPEQPLDARVDDAALRLAEYTHAQITRALGKTGHKAVSMSDVNDWPRGHERVLELLDNYLALVEGVTAA